LRSRLAVTKDGPGGLTLEIPGLEGKPWGYVAGVRPGKRYVSFYLISVYASPELAASMSTALGGRMQGKSCFNFTAVRRGALRGARRDHERQPRPASCRGGRNRRKPGSGEITLTDPSLT
jgi:hypothetical protein